MWLCIASLIVAFVCFALGLIRNSESLIGAALGFLVFAGVMGFAAISDPELRSDPVPSHSSERR
jgi:hypothetical protein